MHTAARARAYILIVVLSRRWICTQDQRVAPLEAYFEIQVINGVLSKLSWTSTMFLTYQVGKSFFLIVCRLRETGSVRYRPKSGCPSI